MMMVAVFRNSAIFGKAVPDLTYRFIRQKSKHNHNLPPNGVKRAKNKTYRFFNFRTFAHDLFVIFLIKMINFDQNVLFLVLFLAS